MEKNNPKLISSSIGNLRWFKSDDLWITFDIIIFNFKIEFQPKDFRGYFQHFSEQSPTKLIESIIVK